MIFPNSIIHSQMHDKILAEIEKEEEEITALGHLVAAILTYHGCTLFLLYIHCLAV